MFAKEQIQAIVAGFHSEGAELNQEQAELVLRIMVRGARRVLPHVTAALSDAEVVWLAVELDELLDD